MAPPKIITSTQVQKMIMLAPKDFGFWNWKRDGQEFYWLKNPHEMLNKIIGLSKQFYISCTYTDFIG
jgi:hypothetical protein